MRNALLILVVAAGACRCLEPVDEGDGGTAGGHAGGTAGGGASAGGAGGGCSSAADCTGAGPATSLCPYFQRDGGFSCTDRTCLYECLPGRTCSTAVDAGCLVCGADAGSCAGPLGCGTQMSASLEQDNGCTGLPAALSLTPIPGACGWTVTGTADGGVLGTIYRLDDGTYLGHLPSLGGTCTGTSLFTQVERWMVSCPVCQFQLQL